jgi:hypothetical protein
MNHKISRTKYFVKILKCPVFRHTFESVLFWHHENWAVVHAAYTCGLHWPPKSVLGYKQWSLSKKICMHTEELKSLFPKQTATGIFIFWETHKFKNIIFSNTYFAVRLIPPPNTAYFITQCKNATSAVFVVTLLLTQKKSQLHYMLYLTLGSFDIFSLSV